MNTSSEGVEVLSIAQVAALLGAVDPEGKEAERFVRKLMYRGMPRFMRLQPPIFIRSQVEAWLRAQDAAQPKRPRQKSRKTDPAIAGAAALDAEIGRAKDALRAYRDR
jgi:hypothetical protein